MIDIIGRNGFWMGIIEMTINFYLFAFCTKKIPFFDNIKILLP